jgi:NADH dehydrogenase [ubiquinone] 1 alpha subcomplex assembly factor 1
MGFAMFRTKDPVPGLFGLLGSEYLDWSSFDCVALRVRGDRRKYHVNIQAESVFPTDLFQHRLFLRSPGKWETVYIPFKNFILTNGGEIQPQAPLSAQQVRSIGIGLIDRQYGPYSLDIDWIKVASGIPLEVESNAPTSSAEDRVGV